MCFWPYKKHHLVLRICATRIGITVTVFRRDLLCAFNIIALRLLDVTSCQSFLVITGHRSTGEHTTIVYTFRSWRISGTLQFLALNTPL